MSEQEPADYCRITIDVRQEEAEGMLQHLAAYATQHGLLINSEATLSSEPMFESSLARYRPGMVQWRESDTPDQLVPVITAELVQAFEESEGDTSRVSMRLLRGLNYYYRRPEYDELKQYVYEDPISLRFQGIRAERAVELLYRLEHEKIAIPRVGPASIAAWRRYCSALLETDG
jgi:hypothetical protein